MFVLVSAFASEPIFSKCNHCIPAVSMHTKSVEGQNAIYQSKLIWEHLQWSSLPIFVLLHHERRGPTFEVYCRQSEPVSPEQTQLFYKHGSGWQWIQSTPYALSRHEVDKLDNYVSRYTIFYLSEIVNDGSWLGQVFAEA